MKVIYSFKKFNHHYKPLDDTFYKVAAASVASASKFYKTKLYCDIQSAALFQENPSVFTFSMQGEKNYPHRKEKSDLDIGLADGTDDATYLSLLDRNLKKLIDEVQPDFMLYQSGVDVLASDQLGRLSLTLEGVYARDRLVLSTAKSQEIPIMCCMGGGYSKRIKDIVEAHAQVFRLAQDLFF